MQSLEICRFEIGYQLKRNSTWIYALILGFLTFIWVMGYVDLARKLNLQINSLLIISGMAAFPGMFALIIIPSLGGDVGIRDIVNRMDQLLYTTSVNKLTFLGARFLSLFLIVLILMIITWLFNIAILFYLEGSNTILFGSFLPQFYLASFLLFTIPNSLIGSAVVYSTVLLTRNAMAGYIVALILFLSSIISMDILVGPVGYYELGKLLDPSGAAILKELRISELDFNIVGVGSKISVVENRFFWLCFSSIILLIAFRKFKFTHDISTPSGANFGRNLFCFLSYVKLPHLLLPLPENTIFALRVRQITLLATRSLREIIWSPGSLVLIAIFLIQFFLLQARHFERFGAESPPITGELIFLMDHPFFKFIITVLITLYAGHLVWREREILMNHVFDTLPIPNYIIFTGKFLGLLSLLILIQMIQAATAMAIQFYHGLYDFEIWLYLQFLFGFQLLDFCLFSAVAFSAHVIINHKYLGHTLIILFYCYTIFPEKLGIHINLLIFGSPGRDYRIINDLNFLTEWVILQVYWVGWVVLFSLIAINIMARGMVLPREKLIKNKGAIKCAPIVRGVMILILLMALLWTFIDHKV